MKKTQIFSFLISVLMVATSLAQQAGADPDVDNFLTQRGITPALPGTNFSGSVYINEDFQRGGIYKNGQLVEANASLRYNVLRDEIEVKPEMNAAENQARILRKNKTFYVKILNDLYVFETRPGYENAKPGYFEVLLESNPMSLYRKHKKQYIEGKKSINSISADILPSFKDDEILFLVKDSGEFIELSGSRNGKLKAFGKDRKVLKRYVKEMDLNINRERDLIKLIEHYNSLRTK